MKKFTSDDLLRFRQNELTELSQLLTKASRRVGNLATVSKGSLIILGALVATRDVVNQIFGTSNSVILMIIYTLMGVVSPHSWRVCL